MGLFNNFPYMDLSNLNLDFILKKLKELNNYVNSAAQDAETSVNAKEDAVAAKEAAQLSAENAAASEESAGQSAESAQNYAEHIADPVGGLVTGWLDDNITPTTPPVDASLTIQGAAADSAKVGQEISDLKSQISTLSSISREVKLAMDTLFSKMAVKDDDTYSSEYGTIHAWATAINVISISAVFDQGDNEFYLDTTLEDLKQYLTVTASYDDGTSGVVRTYTLNGELSAGNNTVIVSYGGKSTTFIVTVNNGWDVTPNLANATKGRASTNYTYDPITKALRVYSSTPATYHAIWYPFTMDSGYEYHLSTGITVTKGKAMIYFTANANNSSSLDSTPTYSESQEEVTKVLSYNANVGRMYFTCTWSTAEDGDVTYSSFKIIKVPVGE